MLGGFRGYFLLFSEISLREKAAAGDFCEALVIFLVLFERSGCHMGGWGKAVGNTSEGELEKRRHCIEEEKKDQASEFTFSRGCER